jgi:hypothetical protein
MKIQSATRDFLLRRQVASEREIGNARHYDATKFNLVPEHLWPIRRHNSKECFLSEEMPSTEWFAVVIFTIEYLIWLVGAGADTAFRRGRNGFTCLVRFIFSFYSIVDILAIVPFYLSMALPNSIVNKYDEYLRMVRIVCLIKLDKYVPSITLVGEYEERGSNGSMGIYIHSLIAHYYELYIADDVLRLKFEPLRVAFYAAVTLWILFAAALYLCEHTDYSNGIDAVPRYGCDDDCTMVDRFQNFFDSMFYTGIHLTGEYEERGSNGSKGILHS